MHEIVLWAIAYSPAKKFGQMSDKMSEKDVERAMRDLDRKSLLKFLGMAADTERVGDCIGLKCLLLESPSTLTVNKANVPFLGRATNGFCSGARLARAGRITVGVPCFETKVSMTGLCSHCDELWSGFDENDLLTLSKHAHSEAFGAYKPGRQGVIWSILQSWT